MSIAEALIGTWSLEGYHVTAGDGARSHPLGASPVGLLIYTREGTMSAQLGSDPADAGATGHIAYAGTYTVREEEGLVAHEVAVSLMPRWRGRTLVRAVAWEGDRLVLRADVADADGAATHVLTWSRLGSGR